MNTPGKISVACLIASYNRKQKTLQFLGSLANQAVYADYSNDVYLLDDCSTDGTAVAVKNMFPNVVVINGTGSLYWAGSMRKAWNYARSQKAYDIFFLLNDDVVLFDNALNNLLNLYSSARISGMILIGSTMDPETLKVSYGGNLFRVHPFKRTKYALIEPDENKMLPCKFGNGNILLVDKTTVERTGILSDLFVQDFADFDYTYNAVKAGITVMLAPGYYGYCRDDHGVRWLSANTSLKKRIEYLYSPKGLGMKEFLRFLKKNFPFSYPTEFFKQWLKTLLPVLWDKFEKKEMPVESIDSK